jgi:tetratricopeptide (TPR) repeat protein
MLELKGKLAALGIPHRLEIFNGSHEWPPEVVVTTAMGWMELLAMKEGRREKDPALVAALWSEDLTRARDDETGGRLWRAWRVYRSMAADFAGLRDTGEAERQAAALAATEALRRDLAARERRDRRDVDLLAQAPALFEAAGLEVRPGRVEKLLADLQVPVLQARKKDDDPEERLSAERVLYALYIQSGLYLPRDAMAAKQWDRAILFLQAAAAIDPASPRIPYRLATAYAGKGELDQALAALRQAVEMKGTDRAEIEGDPALAPLRGTDGYRALLAGLPR